MLYNVFCKRSLLHHKNWDLGSNSMFFHTYTVVPSISCAKSSKTYIGFQRTLMHASKSWVPRGGTSGQGWIKVVRKNAVRPCKTTYYLRKLRDIEDTNEFYASDWIENEVEKSNCIHHDILNIFKCLIISYIRVRELILGLKKIP